METVPGPESTATKSPSLANLESFKELFPGVIQDGALDAARLGEALGLDVTALKDGKERFGLMWAGRQKAVEALQAPSYAALVPDRENSVDWDAAENVFIEGDNLEVLKLMQNAYNDQVKLIYIDPPYNTGNDFVYNDDFSDPKQHYLEVTGQVDAAGNRLVANTEVSGRKHSNWLTMMYPRLSLARNLLTQEGVIVVSIGEDEIVNLRLMMDEIFGPENFISQISLITGANQASEGVLIQKNIEYVLVYSRNFSQVRINRVDAVQETLRSVSDSPTGLKDAPNLGYTVYWRKVDNAFEIDAEYDRDKIGTHDEALVYSENVGLVEKGFVPIRPGKRNGELHRWRWSAETLVSRKDELVVKEANGRIGLYFRQSGFGPAKNYWNFGTGTQELRKLFGGELPFDYPKSTALIEYIIRLTTDKDSLILDFFGGSGTTGHATMLANSRDQGTRKFVLVTLDEPTAKGSKARELGYETIPQITQQRLKLAAVDSKQDAGLRYFRVGKSSFGIPGQSSPDQVFAPKTLDSEYTESNALAQISLLTGERLDVKEQNLGGASIAGRQLIVTAKDKVSNALDLAKQYGCSSLVFLEDLFAGADDTRANLYFACKKANISFKTF
jgi:16S rRNA G966 N2-methylase RsmD